MLRCARLVSLLVLPAILMTLWASAAAVVYPSAGHTITLQQGANGYNGGRDTFVSSLTWDTPSQVTRNYGRNPALEVSRNGGENTLIGFDVEALPPNSAVASATLELYNVTSSPSLPRRIGLFQVVRDWDEGTEVNGPIDAPAKHGATGSNAFAYGGGTPANVPWSAPGMASPADYALTTLAAADVGSAGWYQWDVTALVQRWVRGESANYGLTLRDVTGYQEGNPDDRSFVANDSPDQVHRPRLVITYNPDVPFADAGPDQVNLTWSGGPITLDGTLSHDRPGGNDADLQYRWQIVQAAYGSTLAGDLPLTAATGPFTPDAAGEWELELTVSNQQGEAARDRVRLQLLSLGGAHPRIYLTPAKLAALKARAQAGDPRWQQVLDYANRAGGYTGDHRAETKALVGVVSGQTPYCADAVALAQQSLASTQNYGTKAGEAALVYDWCYAAMSPAQRTQMVTALNAWADDQMADPFVYGDPGWGNYWPNYSFSFALIGVALYGESDRAVEWLEEYRNARFAKYDLPVLEHISAGGDWPEGIVYDWIANPARMQAIEAWRTGTGEDLFRSTGWFAERPRLLLLQNLPGAADVFGSYYHPYLSIGDSERNRGALTNYQRIMGLILIERFPDLPASRQLQAYLAAPQASRRVLDFQAFLEFIFFDPNQPAETPSLTTNFAPAMGTLFVRSGWPDGAADNDAGATVLTFRAGDHFSYHQHFDQGAVSLFKYSDLLLDSGVYSGDGRSYHDVNYYVRTIAHNTLVVYNPQEDLSAARPDAVANDGGQRTVYPATRSPVSEGEWQRNSLYYDTGDMLHVAEGSDYVYALGDLTKAYNNPSYNQAMDTSMAGNTAKVKRFQRELVYLRAVPSPGGATAADGRDYLILYDRTGVTQPGFSGPNTKLLFHVMNEPSVSGLGQAISPGETFYAGANLAAAVNGPGKLYINVLAPPAHNLRVVGGRGQKSFWVFNGNFDWHWDTDEAQPRPVTEWDPIPYGEWRLELEPADNGLDHNFLTILQPTAASAAAVPVVHLAGAHVEGVHILDPAANRVVLFASAVDGGTVDGTVSYDYAPTADTNTLIVDLPPGQHYTLVAAASPTGRAVTLAPTGAGPLVANAAGALSFVLQQDGGVEINWHLYLPSLRRAE